MGQFAAMRLLVMAVVSLGVVLAVGCSPEDGRGDAGCDGAVKTPPNLMRNGGFECGGEMPSEWLVVAGTLSFITTGASEGQRAAQVVSDSSGVGGVGSTKPVVAASSGKTYCITARLKGTASDARLEVIGGSVSSFAAPLNSPNAWVRFPPSTNLAVHEPVDQALYVKVRANNAKAGDTVLVDDIDLWESADGKCKESR